ncbi:MAG TPA: PAS domain-containing protein [Anaerovoracaceae bacterium]|nr:PAS domain-containing protein [Anaerovoracaceae bacterium]
MSDTFGIPNKEQMRLLLESYAQAFWETDKAGKFTSILSSWRDYTERIKEGLFLSGLLNAIHPDDRQYVARQWQESLDTAKNLNIEFRMKSPDGECHWLNVLAIPIRDKDGTVTKWVGMNINISDRKKSEMETAEREARFRALILATSELVYHMNGDCSEMSVMSGYGFVRNTHNPNPTWMQDYVPPEEHAKLTEDINKAIREKSILETEHKVYFEDGRIGWVYSRAVPLLDTSGNIIEWFGIANNITERKITEENLKKSQKHLETLVEKLKLVDERRNTFIGTLSHELRNPLAAISMGLALLKDANPDSDQADRAHSIMERQTEQLTRLVDDLLDVTRITQNKIELKKQRIDLNEIVYHVATDFYTQFTDKGVKLEFELNPDYIWMDADPARLTQAIGNLLHNAAKFTKVGDKAKLSVKFDTENDGQAIITVQDTGLGIDPSFLLRLFDPFEQADSSLAHSYGGLGLGLPIVKGIIELHNGSINAFSDGIGTGSLFIIHLPVQKGNAETIEEKHKGMEEKVSHSLKILIIEDIADLAEILSELLSHLGHDVFFALDGPEGIRKAKHYLPDVLISDIGLPGMSGYEIAEEFQKSDQLKNTYLIALSGYAQPEDFERSRKAGFQQHLAKPVNLESLKAALEAAYKNKAN